ncbi:MAG TPA: acyltransferase, partial [Gemmatimonadaceae bacterium]|nr:acyltransferase [Gemmatimonadaceae bacterium]
MEYRREIDGLRAVAVLPVILFHARIRGFSGGYVGVDVFFVISGYLITSLLVAELDQGRSSIAGFYERRARRILPALCVVMLACLPFAWLWMLPYQLVEFAKSVVAVSVFSSNFLFWWEAGNYFGTANDLKPLLHTWSLAVEEQYYLLFPLSLMLAWRFGRRNTVRLVAGVAMISLALAVWGWRRHAGMAFYLAPFRGWELLLGAMLAFRAPVADNRAASTRSARLAKEGLALAGILLIAWAIVSFDDITQGPTLFTLVPNVGAALIIVCATSETLVGRMLSHRWLVGVGLVSYSAYLWHQPLFAFARIRAREEPGVLLFIG